LATAAGPIQTLKPYVYQASPNLQHFVKYRNEQTLMSVFVKMNKPLRVTL